MAVKQMEIALMLTAYDKASQIVAGFVNASSQKIEKFTHASHELMMKGAEFTEAGHEMTEFLHSTIEAAEENEVAFKRLHQVYKSMGQNANEAAEQNEKYAKSLSVQIGQEDTVVMAVQAKIATFKSLSTETSRMTGMFDRATKAAFDMAATGFGDATTNAAQLGKAMEDPIKGMMGLRRMGIILNEKEKERIKILVESGNKMKAQQVIMQAVERKVGGVAAATATGTQKMKVSWQQTKEAIGKTLLPMWDKLIHLATTYIPKIQKFFTEHQRLIKVVAAVGVGLMVLGTAMNVVGRIIHMGITIYKGFATAVTFLGDSFKNFARVFKYVQNLMLANPITAIIIGIALAAMLIYKYWDKIVAFFKWVWESTKQIFKTFWNWVINLPIMKPIKMIIDNWGKIKKFFADLWGSIKQKFVDFIDWIMNIPKRLYQAGKNMINSLWEGIKSMIMQPINAVKGMVKKIRDFLPFSPAKEGPLRDIHRIRLVETISQNIKPGPVINAMKKVTAAVAVTAMPMQNAAAMKAGGSAFNNSISSGSSAPASITYAPTITIMGTATAQDKMDFGQLLKKHEKEIGRMVEEINRKNNRTKYSS
jgi:phage-related minor tail protein